MHLMLDLEVAMKVSIEADKIGLDGTSVLHDSDT